MWLWEVLLHITQNLYVCNQQQILPHNTTHVPKVSVPLSSTCHVVICRVKKRLFTANVLWYWSSRRSSFIQTFLIFLRSNLVADKIMNMKNFQTKNHRELFNRTSKSSSFIHFPSWHSVSLWSLSFLRYCLCAFHWSFCYATLTPLSSTIILRLKAHWKKSSSREGPECLPGVSSK